MDNFNNSDESSGFVLPDSMGFPRDVPNIILALFDIILGISLDALQYENDWLTRPKYGELRYCRQSTWGGRHYICFIVVGLNILTFSATLISIIIYNIKVKVEVQSTKHTTLSKRWNMFLKLCIIMGFAWPSSICAAIKGRYADTDWMRWIVFVLAVIGNLQGIVIFWIFMCTQRTVAQLKALFHRHSVHWKEIDFFK